MVKDCSGGGAERLIVKLNLERPRTGHANFAARMLGLQAAEVQDAPQHFEGATSHPVCVNARSRSAQHARRRHHSAVVLSCRDAVSQRGMPLPYNVIPYAGFEDVGAIGSKSAKRAGVSFGAAQDQPSEQGPDNDEPSAKPGKGPGKVRHDFMRRCVV